jgi:triacylglycerol lipase
MFIHLIRACQMSDIKEIHLHAECAQIAYLDPKEAKPKFKKLGLKVNSYYDIDGAQAYLLTNKDRSILAFRGTEPKEKSDIFADLNALRDPEPTGGRVHQGFQGEVDKLWPEITKDLLTAKINTNLTVCGHSLGAAMATIAAGRLHCQLVNTNCDFKELYTFGSPRVGNRQWLKHVEGMIHHRCVNNNDLVPKVPPALMLYKHQGNLVYFNCYGSIRKTTMWQRFKDQIRGRRRALQKGQPFDGIYDHVMTEYIRSIDTNLTEE